MSELLKNALIVDAVRTPRTRAKPDGVLAGVKPAELVATLVRALLERTGVDATQIADLLLGCSTQTGDQGANIAKISALWAGLPPSVSGATINRFCASGLDACAYGALKVAAGGEDYVLAGGVESLSRVPMFADRGAWFADPEVAARTAFVHMGVSADLYATREGLGREVLDAWAVRSHGRAARARAEGWFRSVVPVGEVTADDAIRDVKPEKLAALPPIFSGPEVQKGDRVALARYPELERIEHVHTAGTSPALTDGASLLLFAHADSAARLSAKPRARVRAVAHFSTEPVLMLDGNVACTKKALAAAKMSVSDVDLFEVNESFAVVPVAYARAFDLDDDRLLPNGGAIALGHPLGATGGILLGMLLDELERRDKTVGLASICGGAGVATTMIVERV